MKLSTPLALLAAATAASGAALEKRAYGPPVSKGDVCPAGQGFFFKAASGKFYQIACAVDVIGGTLLAVYANYAGIVDCAAQCDLWTTQVPSRPCLAAAWYRFSPDGANNCFIRGGTIQGAAQSKDTLNAVSALL
ncbi:hypothetical protein RB595_003437 [Gaeumannomyces hyphopodioides]